MANGNNVKTLLILGFIFMLVLVGVAYGADVLLNAASNASNTITAYYVPNAQINEGDPGSEASGSRFHSVLFR